MPRWLIILQPLAVPLAVAGVGALAAIWTIRTRRGWLEHHRRPVLFVLFMAAVISAWVPNGGQFFYERGLPLPTFEYVQAASYFPFAFTVLIIWHFVAKYWQRGLLVILVPVSFAQPLLWTWAYFSWTVWGFAP